MTCPGCNDSFVLTWRLYVKSGRGRFSCPLCGVRLRGRHRWFYWVLLPSAVFGALAVIMMATVSCLGLLGAGFAGLAMGFLVGVWLDRFLESRFGILTLDV